MNCVITQKHYCCAERRGARDDIGDAPSRLSDVGTPAHFMGRLSGQGLFITRLIPMPGWSAGVCLRSEQSDSLFPNSSAYCVSAWRRRRRRQTAAAALPARAHMPFSFLPGVKLNNSSPAYL